MKHLLNNLSEEEKQSILEQHKGGMKVFSENFKRLISHKSGTILNEQSQTGSTVPQTGSTVPQTTSSGNTLNYLKAFIEALKSIPVGTYPNLEGRVNIGVREDGTFVMESYNPTVNQYDVYLAYQLDVYFDDDDLNFVGYRPDIPNEKEKLTQIVISIYFTRPYEGQKNAYLMVNYPIQDYSKAFDTVKSILQILHGTEYQPNNQPTFEDIIKQLENIGLRK